MLEDSAGKPRRDEEESTPVVGIEDKGDSPPGHQHVHRVVLAGCDDGEANNTHGNPSENLIGGKQAGAKVGL